MKKNKCLFCDSKTKGMSYNLPTFDHFGFKTVSNKIFFKKCLKCSLIFNPKKIKNTFFKSKQYVEETNDHVLHKVNRKLITRKTIVSKIIAKVLKNTSNPKILEIGCSDGLLLKKLDKKLNKGFFYGTEISPYNRKKFPKKKNFNLFIRPNLSTFRKQSIDLIILSHVFNYLPDPKKTLYQFRKLLKSKGQLFIVLPNIIKNPYYSLMGDQKLILTYLSLSNLLKMSGFKSKIVSNKCLKRELIVLAKKTNFNKFICRKDYIFEKNIKKINKMKFKFLKQNLNHPIIFGTSINSACLDEFTKKKTSFFVDEFSNKLKKSFRGKKIIHPRKLKKDDQIIFSFYKNKELKKKLKKKYLSKIISI